MKDLTYFKSPEFLEALRKDPDCFDEINHAYGCSSAREDPNVLKAFWEGLNNMPLTNKDIFRRMGWGQNGMKVPVSLTNADAFLKLSARMTGFGYAHIKQSKKEYLITAELIEQTISNMETLKELGYPPINYDIRLMFECIPTHLMTEQVAHKLLKVCPEAVRYLPERFINDGFFTGLLNDDCYLWLLSGKDYYGKVEDNRLVKEVVFSRLSSVVLEQAISMAHGFYHPEDPGKMEKRDYDDLLFNLPDTMSFLLDAALGKTEITGKTHYGGRSGTEDALIEECCDLYGKLLETADSASVKCTMFSNNDGYVKEELLRHISKMFRRVGGDYNRTVNLENDNTWTVNIVGYLLDVTRGVRNVEITSEVNSGDIATGLGELAKELIVGYYQLKCGLLPDSKQLKDNEVLDAIVERFFSRGLS